VADANLAVAGELFDATHADPEGWDGVHRALMPPALAAVGTQAGR
jgi:hypothetical protein